jgi:hypothetical protein
VETGKQRSWERKEDNGTWRVSRLCIPIPAGCGRRVKAPSKIIELCAVINPAYTSTRYPDVASEFYKGEVEDIVKSAKEILEWTKKELKL